VFFHHLLDLFLRHFCGGGARRGRGSSSVASLLTWLALLAPVWLALRSCWYDVSVEYCEARRDRRMSERLTLSGGLLEERGLSGGCWRRLLAIVDLPQRVSAGVLRCRRHGVLRGRRDGRRGFGRLRGLALLRVVRREGWGLEGRWLGTVGRRRAELLRLLRVNRCFLLHNLRQARGLGVLQFGELLRRDVLALVRLRLRLGRRGELLLLVRRILLGVLRAALALLVLVVALLVVGSVLGVVQLGVLQQRAGRVLRVEGLVLAGRRWRRRLLNGGLVALVLLLVAGGRRGLLQLVGAVLRV
jgi:hypothetical protein